MGKEQTCLTEDSHPAGTKGQCGSPLAVFLGETYVRPYTKANFPSVWPNGLNPFGEYSVGAWNNMLTWNALVPRVGLTYNIFGTNKTVLKLSFSQYSEYLRLELLSTASALFPYSPVQFYYYDINQNGVPDTGDNFTMLPYDFSSFNLDFAKTKVDPKTKPPLTNEYQAGVWHELFANFSLGVNFIYKNTANIVEDALYNSTTGQYWFDINTAEAKKYWIPFTTTVPGADAYPSRTVTFYVQSNSAPPIFYKYTNPPGLTMKYWAMEFLFNKRMTNGWQVSGSVLYSKTYGNMSVGWNDTVAITSAANTPNYYVNLYGRTSFDRPLQIKLMGTVVLPYHVLLSGYYRFFSGSPWGRSVSIRPPASWCTANNAFAQYYSVYLEAPGTRRTRSTSILDAQLEKEFPLGKFGKLRAYIDALNLLGWSDVSVSWSDTCRWDPSAEGARQPGVNTLNPSYKRITGVSGQRIIKLSVRYSF